MNLDNDYLRDAQYRNAGLATAGTEIGTTDVVNTTSSAPAQTSEVVSGKSVNVVATSDFEKLLETLKLETEEQKRKLAIQQLSDIITRLVREVDNLGTADKDAVKEIAEANEKKQVAESDISKYSSLASLKSQELENLTKQLREVQQEINEKRREEKRENATEIKNGTDDVSLAELEAKELELQSKISVATGELADIKASYNDAIARSAAADKDITAAHDKLSASALAIFAEAAKIAATANAVDTDSQIEDPAITKMREAAAKLVGDLADKLEGVRKDDLQKALDAMIMKTVPAGDLPGHEIKA